MGASLKYTFSVVGGGTETFIPPFTTKLAKIEIEGDDAETAFNQAVSRLPEGARILCWFDNREVSED
jgi:hypothetical protein